MKKILIIEDEEVLLNILKEKLQIEGYDVFIAKDGVEGVALMREIKPDLVLLDILMPRQDGFEVLDDMRNDATLKDVPVIIISNSGQPVEIDRALKLGAKDYLVKAEFDPQEVVEKVQRFLGKSEKVEKKEEKKNAGEVTPANYKILIVEDDKFLRDLMTQKIAKDGFNVVEATDGESGYQKIVSEKPSIVLLDLIMPGLDGFEVLKKIQENPEISGIPVIILSNLGQKDDVEKGMRLGAKDYLIKAHFTPKEIIDKVKNILSA
jgi:DNA-binding response OmpR family regulator